MERMGQNKAIGFDTLIYRCLLMGLDVRSPNHNNRVFWMTQRPHRGSPNRQRMNEYGQRSPLTSRWRFSVSDDQRIPNTSLIPQYPPIPCIAPPEGWTMQHNLPRIIIALTT